jgi:PAS domain S-box-containing protein
MQIAEKSEEEDGGHRRNSFALTDNASGKSEADMAANFSQLELKYQALETKYEQLLVSHVELDAHYSSVFSALEEGVVLYHRDGTVVSWNDAAEHILGLTGDQLQGRTFVDPSWIAIREDGSPFLENDFPAPRVFESGKPVTNAIMGIQKPGNSFNWIQINALPIFRFGENSFENVVVYFSNVTEKKKASEKILQLSMALEQSPEMVVITDMHANIEYVNTAFVQATGYQREEVLGQNPRILQSGLTPSETYTVLWDTLGKGETWKGHLSNRRKDGSEYIESASITPVRQSDGRITHYVAVKHDITRELNLDLEMDLHRYHLEELVQQRTVELTAAREQAEIANTAKSRFLAATSHDLRQPLSALNLYVGVLKKNINPENEQLVGYIQNCVDSLSELLTSLLDVSKLDAHVIHPEFVDFSVAELFSTLVSIYSAEADLKGLKLRVRYTNAFVRTDQRLLQRIVGNLLANAIQHTVTGGVLLTYRHWGGRQWIEVWDSGVGIPSEKFDFIFEEFRQLDEARTRGSGLGLSIVAKASKLLGLEIRLRSRPGHGSMFAIEVPPGRALSSQGTSTSHLGVRPLRIALVEDNLGVLQALELTLSSVGHEVIAASNIGTLLEKLGQACPDLIISDYRLGAGETGFNAIEKVRERFGDDLPAFIITGDTDPTLVRSMAAHDIAIQYKPLKLDVLQTFIEQITERRRRQSNAPPGAHQNMEASAHDGE